MLNQFEEKIYLERKSIESNISQKIKLHQSLPLLKDQFTNNIIAASKSNEFEFSKGLKEFDLEIYTKNMQICIISLYNYKDILSREDPKETTLKAFTLRNIAEESLSSNDIKYLSCENKYGLVRIYVYNENFSVDINTIIKTLPSFM